MRSLNPSRPGDQPASYRAQLQKRGANFVVTAERAPLRAWRITRGDAVEAARSFGFDVIATFVLPDGRRAWLWADRS